MDKNKTEKRNKNIFSLIFISFILVIVTGTILLCLPFSSVNGEFTPIMTSFFTSVSSVCVTGLSLCNTGTWWSTFGQVVILIMIQIGGLGFMTFVAVVSYIISNRLSLKTRKIISESTAVDVNSNLKPLIKYIFISAFSFETAGALLLAPEMIKIYGTARGIFVSVFTSVSAFCNAGFETFGDLYSGSSLEYFKNNPLVIFTVSFLIISGGLGFTVWEDIFRKRKWSKFSLHTKIILSFTAFLLISGTVIMFVSEYNNPETCGEESIPVKLMHSFFNSVNPRTAGFAIHDYSKMTGSSVFTTNCFMIIGGAPGSTAGGLKISVFALLILAFISTATGAERITVFKKRIADDITMKACAVTTAYLAAIITGTILISVTENFMGGFDLSDVIFEVVSATTNTGVSMGITSELSVFSQLVLCVLMFLGRVGFVSFACSLFDKNKKEKNILHYPQDKIYI